MKAKKTIVCCLIAGRLPCLVIAFTLLLSNCGPLVNLDHFFDRGQGRGGSFDEDPATSPSPERWFVTDGSGTITGFSQEAPQNTTEISIPSMIGSTPITIIGNGAFRHAGLTRVTIPNGVITIEQQAFWENNLTSLTIPASVILIEDSAFRWNEQLNEIVILGRPDIHLNAFMREDIPDAMTIIIGPGATLIMTTFPHNFAEHYEDFTANAGSWPADNSFTWNGTEWRPPVPH